MQYPVLVIFCKRPMPGQGKQRIAATLGEQVAYQVASALLQCALEDARAWPGQVALSPVCEADAEWAAELLDREHLIVPQCEGNLGKKLNYVDQVLREQGYSKLLFIGTDAPEHSLADYRQLIEMMTDSDVVLSPADDGGVTAMGSAYPWPALEALPWSTETLGDSLAELCSTSGFQVAFSPVNYDVDNESDLQRLRRSLAQDIRPARQQLLLKVNSLFD